MKKLGIFLGIVIIIIILLHLAFFVFINKKGKDIILSAVERNLKLEASLDFFSLKFPFTVEIKNFKCGDITFKKADLSVGLLSLFTGELTLNKIYITDLNLKLVKDRKGIRIQPISGEEPQPVEEEILEKKPLEEKTLEEEKPEEPASSVIEPTPSAEPSKSEVSSKEDEVKEPAPVKVEEKPQQALSKPKESKESPSVEEEASKRKIPLKIKNLYIKDSSIELLDLTKRKSPGIIFENVNASLKNFSYPDLPKFYIDFKASLRTEQGVAEEGVNIKGWVDYFNKDMDVDLNLDSIDYFILSNYYPPFWKPDNLGIKEAYLSLNANLNSKNNDLVIEGVLSLDKVDFVEEGSPNSALLKTVIALLKGDKEKANLRFKLKTKMDSPKLDFSSVEKQFKDLIPMGPAVIAGEVIGKTKEETVDKAIDTIKSVTDIFRRKPKPQEEAEAKE